MPRARPLSPLQERLDAWAATGHDWLWEATPEGLFTFSASVVNHCGYGPDETAGLGFFDVVHSEDHQRLRRVMEAGKGWQGEIWHCVGKDGIDVWLRGSARATLDAAGRVRSYLGTAQLLADVADRELVRRAQAAYIGGVLASEALSIVFQPIVATDSGRLIGAEALTRFTAPAPTPDVVFTQAAEVGLGVELELLAVRTALAAAVRLPSHIYVSINVSPPSLLAPELRAVLSAGAVPTDRIVLEITEHASIADYAAVVEVVQQLRQVGVRFAVDDAGAGFASARHIVQLKPDFIKLDRTLVAGIDQDPALRAFGSAIVLLALELGSKVIAEGIETIEELKMAELLGMDAAQGYFLGRPTADWDTWARWQTADRLYPAR